MAKFSSAVIEAPVEKESPKALTAKEIGKAKMEKLIEEEGKKLVKGKFKNYETPGASAEIQCRKYPEDKVPFFKKKMNDGEVYEIPLYVARWLNGTDKCAEQIGGKIYSCSHLIHGYSMDKNGAFAATNMDDHGIPVPIFTNKYRQRYGFESLEFEI